MPDVMTPEQINETIRYASWAVLARDGSIPPETPAALDAWIAGLAEHDIVVRGMYDTSVMRADGDIMVWLHGPTAEGLQAAVRELRRDVLGNAVTLVWSAMALHRPAEFNKQHVPVFLSGLPAQDWVVVYPFTRSYDWYLLPDPERRWMLSEHGSLARDYPQVHNSTLAAFALGDYEWMLSIESEQLHDIVDLMRHLRESAARRHVRAEVPFFTGRRIDTVEVADVLR